MERYERWEPIEGIEAPIFDVDIVSQRGALLTLQLIPATTYGGTDRELILRFGAGVIAFMFHEEFAHPWNDHPTRRGPLPRADNPPSRTFTFPLLRVLDSEWLASFSPARLDKRARATIVHYQIVTSTITVDILTLGDVNAEWAPAAS